jgi:hypothetical protein
MENVRTEIPAVTTFDLREILASKKRFRSQLADLPFEEKLRLLEAMRDRHLAFAAVRDQDRSSSEKE